MTTDPDIGLGLKPDVDLATYGRTRGPRENVIQAYRDLTGAQVTDKEHAAIIAALRILTGALEGEAALPAFDAQAARSEEARRLGGLL